MNAPSPALAREARLVAETGHLEGRRPHAQHSIATRAQEHMEQPKRHDLVARKWDA